jgi:hypothetical protein
MHSALYASCVFGLKMLRKTRKEKIILISVNTIKIIVTILMLLFENTGNALMSQKFVIFLDLMCINDITNLLLNL